jgi:ATP-dependent Clp protease ATP-binding subunit ClpB
MTSNLGSDLIQEMAGDENYEAMKDAVMGVVGNHFRPEFINRVDETVVFHPLSQVQIRGIASIQIANLMGRLAERDLVLQLPDDVLDHLAAAGFDPVFGARPLKRAIQQLLENPLAQQILQGDYAPGDTVEALLESQKIILSRQQ